MPEGQVVVVVLVAVAVAVLLLRIISLITTTLTNICLSIVEWEEKVLRLHG